MQESGKFPRRFMPYKKHRVFPSSLYIFHIRKAPGLRRCSRVSPGVPGYGFSLSMMVSQITFFCFDLFDRNFFHLTIISIISLSTIGLKCADLNIVFFVLFQLFQHSFGLAGRNCNGLGIFELLL